MQENDVNEISTLTAEKKKELSDRALARSVVREILDFGVNNNQIKEIIKQLALELEDRSVMLKIFEFLGESEEQETTKIYT